MARQKSLSLAVILVGASVGCVGTIGDRADGTGPTPGIAGPGNQTPGKQPTNPNTMTPGKEGTKPTDPPDPNTPPDPNAAGPMPLRRLNLREYNNTVADLLGDKSHPADKFPSDRSTEFAFAFRHSGLVASQDYATIQDAAESLAAAVEKDVGSLAPCAAGGNEDDCAKTFATKFGLRAYRRPLVDGEVASLVTLYKDARTKAMATYAGGIRAMVEGILQAPQFIYHWESGPHAPTVEGDVVKLSPWENASRLSYFIWGSMPDQALFDAAAANKLGTKEELEAQAKRMLGSDRAKETVAQFVEEWLGLDMVTERSKDTTLYPNFKDDLKAAMLAEAHQFVKNVVFDGDGKLDTLLTATFSFVNQANASVYGMKNVTGPELKQMSLDSSQRAGLLTQPAFLTVTGASDGSNPVKRGHKVLYRLLCEELPPTPDNVPPPKPASAGGTTRERFAEHSANDCARGCHSILDPLGFAFEHYDGIGGWRTMDNGGMVDSSGTVEIDGKMHSFGGAPDLVKTIAGLDQVKACFAKHWARFAWKRMETQGDRASIDAIVESFGKAGHTVRELMVGVAGSRSFRYRALAQGETL